MYALLGGVCGVFVMRRKRKSITETVHPAILERATAANERYNKHLTALRERGYTIKVRNRDGSVFDMPVGGDIPLDLSALMVEAASIIKTMEGLKK